jgi:serine/threonine-protein kinase
VVTRLTEATQVQALPPMFAPGTVLRGRYRIDGELGVGGCSFVLRAHDAVLGQPVAIKILRPDVGFARDMEARLMREARAVGQLTSPHVVRVFDAGMLDEGAPFLVMELLHGTDLCALLARQRMLPPAIAVDFVLQACDALGEAHALGIVHRDIKPSNLFVVTHPDGSKIVKVLDFGISKSPVPDGDPSLTQTAALLGTPAYMAPEQMRSARNADARSDVWALGTVLYELVEGRMPMTAESFAELVLAASTQPHAPLIAARPLAPVIARCLAKTPDDRYPNMAELAADLARFTDRPLGLACAERAARVLGIAPRVQVPAVTVVAPAAPRAMRRIATVAAITAAIAIPALVLATRPARAPAQAKPPPAVSAPVEPVAAVTDAAPAVAPPPAPPAVQTAAPTPAVPTPSPIVRTTPPGSPATAAPAPAAKPAVRRKPASAGSAGCDPYARPEGC